MLRHFVYKATKLELVRPKPGRDAGLLFVGCRSVSKANDMTRGTSAQRGYNNRWAKARATYLRSHPLCAMHLKLGKYVPATVVDHITPHRGDQTLFWDRSNWQSLCTTCHSSHKQRQERGGPLAGCDVSGRPIDPAHPWNQAG